MIFVLTEFIELIHVVIKPKIYLTIFNTKTIYLFKHYKNYLLLACSILIVSNI
jgi:hypothetical protein